MYYDKPKYRKERWISTNDSWRIRVVADMMTTRRLPYRIEDPDDRPRTIYFKASDREYADILLYTGLRGLTG